LPTEQATMQCEASQLEYGIESVRSWKGRTDINDGW
jgi:hypothetical protein